MMYYYSCPNALFFLSTVLVNIRIKRKWLWFWYGTILVWQIGGIPADDNFCKIYSNKMKLCFVHMPGGRWCLQYSLPTCPNTLSYDIYFMTCGVWCNNCCKHVHFKLFRKFICHKDLCTYSAGSHTPYYPSIFFIIYNQIFPALPVHVKRISITHCTEEEGELWTMDSTIIISGLEFWYMPIQHQNNCVVWSTTPRYMQKEI